MGTAIAEPPSSRIDAQTWTDLQLLLGRYCDACDRFDVDDFMSCWSQTPTLALDPAVGA